MYTYPLEEMSEQDALLLCQYLGKIKHIPEKEGLYLKIASVTQNLPFYINLVFIELSKGVYPMNETGVEKVINTIVQDVPSNGHFDHFRERLDAYYEKEYSLLAYQILTCLCESKQPLSRNDTVQAVLQLKEADEDLIKQIIKDLTQDFYLTMTDRRYTFRYKLLQDWWLTHYA